MSGRVKRVLVVDDEDYIRHFLGRQFVAYSDDANSVFTFEVLTAPVIEDAINLIRANHPPTQFDVIVLDLSFDKAGLDRSGLHLAAALGLLRRLRQEIPVVIVFSGYADVPNGVKAMRCGAWDVIDKRQTSDDRSAYELVVESAVSRLQALDLQDLLNVAAVKWFQQHVTDLKTRYEGQVVAIWHEPDVRVVASGRDVFELEMRLDAWRRGRPEWMYPFVVEIPPTSNTAGAYEVQR